MRLTLMIAALAVTYGCGGKRTATFDAAQAPEPREIVRTLLRVQETALRSHSSCATAGTSMADVDLGDYVSGWLVELKQGPGANWIETAAVNEPIAGESQEGWRCTVTFRHVDGDDRWGWGVSFLLRANDRSLVDGSIRCLGAG